MEIGNLVDSQIMQLYPVDFAKDIFTKFTTSTEGGEDTPPAQEEKTTSEKATVEQPAAAATQEIPPQPSMQQQGMPQNMGMPNMQMGMANMQMGMQQPMNGMPGYGMPAQDLNIQPAQFQSFSPGNMNLDGIAPENIDLIMDVPLEVTVELGRTSKSIRDILDFAPGTIIELNKLAGEPIDVLVNGKFVAKGEVVVIEESFGIRVTEIIKD
jgi:flagellar motor switch protein FliN/FliY